MKVSDFGFDWIVWALFLSVPMIVFWQVETSLTEQGVASGGAMENAATFPLILAWVMIILSGVNGIRILAGRVAQTSPLRISSASRLALGCTALFVVYLLCLDILGYYLATPILLLIYLSILGVTLWRALPAACLMCLVIAFVFEGLLDVVLPLGISKFTLFG